MDLKYMSIFGHISKTSINMADEGKFGGKRRRELKEEKKNIYKIMLIIIINITSIEGDECIFIIIF